MLRSTCSMLSRRARALRFLTPAAIWAKDLSECYTHRGRMRATRHASLCGRALCILNSGPTPPLELDTPQSFTGRGIATPVARTCRDNFARGASMRWTARRVHPSTKILHGPSRTPKIAHLAISLSFPTAGTFRHAFSRMDTPRRGAPDGRDAVAATMETMPFRASLVPRTCEQAGTQRAAACCLYAGLDN
jgi:hypothetical protein